MRLIYWLTGGRPMTLIVDRPAFFDNIAGRAVFYWRDGHGRLWMASGPWSLFRVEVKP